MEEVKTDFFVLGSEKPEGNERVRIVESEAEELPVVSDEFGDIPDGRGALHIFHFITEDPLMTAENPAFFTWLENGLLLQIFFLLSRVA